MRAARSSPEPVESPAGPAPLRTCVGCRRVRSQAVLVRLARTTEGFVEPDPGRRGGGRGAYVCRQESCLSEAIRRSRWAHAFRAPAVLRPETLDRLGALIGLTPERPGEQGGDSVAGLGTRPGMSVKGGW